ncbi:MAG: glycosyltransferase family 4 protein [Candidatus Methylomirabilota bacterium]|jgi:glycosyltransferase involved in cell wall biosynthesis
MREPAVAMPEPSQPQAEIAGTPRGNVKRPGVLMLISHFPPAVGGAERQAHRLAAGLARAGHRVTVLTLARPGAPTREVRDGIAVERTLTSTGRGALFAATYGASLLRHLRRLHPGHAVLHAHHLYLEAMAAACFSLRAGLPAIAKVACGGPDGDFARLKRTGLTLSLPLLRRLRRVVAISAETETELLAHNFAADRIVRIPNGVDQIRFAPAPNPEVASRQMGFGPETVLFLGRLDAQKGLDVALDAWALVAARRPAARLLLAGDGPARTALEEKARELGLTGRARFLGTRPDPERLLQACQILVLPSRSEGMSNALLEAMATGLACVASRIGGNTDLVEHGVTGLLTPPGDAASLADALCALLEDKVLRGRLGTAARAAAVARYGMDRVVRDYMELYTALTGDVAR